MYIRWIQRVFAVGLVSSLFLACQGSPNTLPVRDGLIADQPWAGHHRPSLPATKLQEKIKHIVIIVQENRSFDNLFDGFPGAATQSYGYEHNGTRVQLHSIDWSAQDIYHGIEYVFAAYDSGKMDGFDLQPFSSPPYHASGKASYAFLQRDLIKPYWTMAQQYVLADHMFPSSWGGSFPAHLDLIAGTSRISSTQSEQYPNNVPWGCDAPPSTVTQLLTNQHQFPFTGPFPCFTQLDTMADTLDSAGVTWKYYAPSVTGQDWAGQIWSEFDAIKKVRYGPDWTRNVISPETTVLSDISAGTLPAVSWVIPSSPNSDHGHNLKGGPAWVSSVVNAIGNSKYWNTSAIIVLWDDWGGWYDNVKPPQLDWEGLGFRVPCIIVSPYALPHTVVHTQYEFGSILKLVEQAFKVPPLGNSDVRANSLVDSFNFNQSPRPFTPIKSDRRPAYFLHELPSSTPPDDN